MPGRCQASRPARRPNLRAHLREATYIVIERFDRLPPLRGSAFVRRVHQEICARHSAHAWAKYQQDGGPGIPDMVALIRRVGSDPETDVYRFIDANAFNC